MNHFDMNIFFNLTQIVWFSELTQVQHFKFSLLVQLVKGGNVITNIVQQVMLII